MSKIRQIFLDKDGVLADFESGLTKALGYKVDLKAKKDVYDQEKRKLTAQRLFRNLEPLPDAWKLVDYCLNSGIHTEILTAAGTVNRTLVVKDKISEGKSKEEIYHFLTSKYGEWIVYKPAFNKYNFLLWTLPYLTLIFGRIVIFFLLKKKKNQRLN